MSRRSFLMIKPDAYGLTGPILEALHERGLAWGRMLSLQLSRAAIEMFYAEHVGRPYFEAHAAFMTSGRSLGLEVISDENVIERVRALVGATDPAKASPETLRGRFGTALPRNAVHASDSELAVSRELLQFFSQFPLICPM